MPLSDLLADLLGDIRQPAIVWQAARPCGLRK